MPDALGHIATTDVDLNYPTSDFLDLVLNTLGNAGDPSDGFDQQLAQTVNDSATILNDLDAIDAILGLSVLLGDPTGDSVLSDNTPGMQANLANAANDVGALNDLALTVGITPLSGTPPSPTGPPPSNPTTQTCEGCSASSAIAPLTVAQTGQPQTVPANFINVFQKTIYLTSLVLTSSADGVFTLTPEIGVNVPYNETVSLGALVFTDTGPGLYCATMEAGFSDGSYAGFCAQVNVQAASS